MGKLFKLLVLLGFVGGLAYGFSYAGARAGVGKMLGSAPEVGERTMRFQWNGADSLPGRPRVWEVTLSRVTVIGNRRAIVYVSPGGAILATYPKDLAWRLETAAKARDEP